MTVENPHPLFIQQLKLLPTDEWSPQCRGWVMVRVAEGSGYCIQKGKACELNVGDGFMSPASTSVSIRASQLGSMHLQWVRIEPDLIYGLLTVSEWLKLEAVQRNSSGVVFFKANELAGQKFARLTKQACDQRLSFRCGLLQLWANTVDSLLAAPAPGLEPDKTKLRQRFRKLVEQMPEAELFRHSLPDLARQLKCSDRHFGRLFSEEFGISFRSHQIESRLQHARRLLTDPGKKIASVANESGYRHTGLFNFTFKKRFGVTPSEWRRQTRINQVS